MILLSPLKFRRQCRITVSCLMLLSSCFEHALTAEGILDFERFKSQIEPLLTTQTYNSPGPGPMTCASCHGDPAHPAYPYYSILIGNSLHNYTEAARRVQLDEPDLSLLLRKPLDVQQGGVPHGLPGFDGGEQFANTTSDPNYLAIYNWIVDATQANQGARVSRTEAYPTPFRVGTHIVYFLTTTALQVDIRVYSSNGYEVRNFNGTTNIGANQVFWDGRDSDFEPLPTGVYFYSVKARFEDGTFLKSGRCVYTP